MSKIFNLRKDVDFEASCNRLVKGMNLANDKIGDGTGEQYARAYGILQSSVAVHLVQCLDVDGRDELTSKKQEDTENDIPPGLFESVLSNPSNEHP